MYQDALIKQGRLKRIFRAKRKLTQPKLVSHITQRAAGKEPLFVEDTDYLFMLSDMKDIIEKRSLEMYAFCLMPNHIHLLVRPQTEDLSEAMRDLFSRFAMRFNRKYERKGHLFGGPYRQAICLDDTYLLAASLYIHMNPVRAGLVKNPRKYQWSSVKRFIDTNAPHSFVETGLVLGLLQGTEGERKRTYAKLLGASSAMDVNDVLEQEDAVSRFRRMLARAFPQIFPKTSKSNAAKDTVLMDDDALEEKIAALKTGQISGKPATRAARRFLIEQLISRGYTREDIAATLEVSIKTVYNTLKAAC